MALETAGRATDGARLERFTLLFTLTARRWPVMEHERKDRPSEAAVVPMGAGRRCRSCGVGQCFRMRWTKLSSTRALAEIIGSRVNHAYF
jgi:hypothetical protein